MRWALPGIICWLAMMAAASAANVSTARVTQIDAKLLKLHPEARRDFTRIYYYNPDDRDLWSVFVAPIIMRGELRRREEAKFINRKDAGLPRNVYLTGDTHLMPGAVDTGCAGMIWVRYDLRRDSVKEDVCAGIYPPPDPAQIPKLPKFIKPNAPSAVIPRHF